MLHHIQHELKTKSVPSNPNPFLGSREKPNAPQKDVELPLVPHSSKTGIFYLYVTREALELGSGSNNT